VVLKDSRREADDPLPLAKLISWAGTLHSRKKMQKVVFMLQAAGCPLDAEFYLHLYGTYSEDVARLTDEMVRKGLLEEETKPTPSGSQYSYRLSDQISQQMVELEETEDGKKRASELAPFEAKAKSLLQADVKQLAPNGFSASHA
jgi:uncharacterized protein YwgA